MKAKLESYVQIGMSGNEAFQLMNQLNSLLGETRVAPYQYARVTDLLGRLRCLNLESLP